MQPWTGLAAGCLLAAPAGWGAARLARPYADADRKPPIPILAAAAASLFAWAALAVPFPGILILSFGLGAWLLTLATVDLMCFRLPDRFTLPLILAGLSASVVLPGAPVVDHLAGALGGYGLLAVLATLYRAWRGTDGIGMGDAKLLAAAGAWLGWRPLPSVILIACGLSFLWIALIALRRGRLAQTQRIAFGAPLCAALWIVWLHGPLIA
jgi:leader peptidase (prepilin peptidase)/N-methyltransferase